MVKRGISLIGVLLLAAGAAGCGAARGKSRAAKASGPIRQDCVPQFVPKNAWYGGDGAYSIPLSEERSLWIFGDSFASDVAHLKTRAGTRLHSGTMVADARCYSNGQFSIRYVFGQDADGKRAMLFRPSAPEQLDPESPSYLYYWPLDGFVHNGKLYLALAEIAKKHPEAKADVMNFKVAGTLLAVIANYRSDVPEWKIEYRRLSRGELATPGGGIAIHEGYAYLFTYFNDMPGRAPRALARLPLSALDDDAPQAKTIEASLEFLAAGGLWKPGLPDTRAEAVIVMGDNATEMTVRHLPEIGKWTAVYNYAEGFGTATMQNRLTPGDRVVYRLADSPLGPWSEPKTLFKIEARALTRGRYDPSVFCYAAKLHPQYMRRGRVAATYVCNSTDFFGTLIKNLPIYTPQVRWVPLADFK